MTAKPKCTKFYCGRLRFKHKEPWEKKCHELCGLKVKVLRRADGGNKTP